MDLDKLYKAVNQNTSEVKYFELPIGRKIFLQANRNWVGIGR